MPNYQNGKIYKIVPNSEHAPNEQYIGSTTKRIVQRLERHRENYGLYQQGQYCNVTVFRLFEKYGMENCTIELVELFPCDSKNALETREGYHIRNNSCVNKLIAGRTRKQYREDHKEKIAAEKVKWYLAHKEVVNKRNIEYNRARKDIVSKQRARTFLYCDCGSCVRLSDKPAHLKTKKHLAHMAFIKSLEETNNRYAEVIRERNLLIQ